MKNFKSAFQRNMWLGCGISLFGWIAALVIDSYIKIDISPVSATFMTFFYHIAVRLLFGELILMKILPKKLNYNLKYFDSDNRFENWVYKKLNLKKAISKAPTYSPEEFSLENNSWENIVIATVRSEIVHTVNVFLSFLSLLFTLKFDAFWVFLITSVLAAAFDFYFVMLQRCNRPRLIRIAKHSKK